MHVCFAAGGLGQGGAEKQLLHMVRALRGRDHLISVVSFSTGDAHESELRSLGVALATLPRTAGRFERLRTLRRFIRQSNVDVLQAAHTWLNPYVATACLGTASLAVGAIRSDGRFEVAQNPLWGRLSLAAPATIVANSRAAAHVARSFALLGKRTIAVVPNVIGSDDLTELAPSPAPSPIPDVAADKIVVLTVANITTAKRLDVLIEAFAEARAVVGASLLLWIAGDGPELSRIQVLVRERLMADGAVTFLGRRPDVRDLMDRSAIYVLSSDHEGFPNTILEAMASGLPVVATNVGAVPDVIEDGVTGFIVARRCPSDLADRLVQLARDANQRRRIGAEAARRVAMRFSPDGLALRLERVYREATR